LPDENIVVTSSKRIFEPNRMDTPLTEIMSTGLGWEIDDERNFPF
jgi:hypothetical protein